MNKLGGYDCNYLFLNYNTNIFLLDREGGTYYNKIGDDMKNKKGFTLVELLAVIAILAILVIIAIPNVIGLFNKSRKNIFLTEAKSAINKSSDKYISESINGNKIDHVSSSDETKLNLSGTKLSYDIKLNGDGNVLSYVISDGKYCLDSNKKVEELDENDVLDGLCDNLNDLNNVLGREDLKDGIYLTDKILEDNKISIDNDIDFNTKNYSGDKYTINIDSKQTSYEMIDGTTYYYGNSFEISNKTGKLIPTNNGEQTREYTDNMVDMYNSGYDVFCADEEICSVMYKIDNVEDNILTVKVITTMANQRISNGNGMFVNNDSGSKIYYFRGDVKNNYISFGDILWRIVRFNDDYSIRIITDESVTNSAYNDSVGDNAYVGYMYGSVGSDSYSKTHSNSNSSTIKKLLDEIYKSEDASFTKYITDAGFCADRTLVSPEFEKFDSTAYGITGEDNKIIDTGLGYGKNFTLYSVFYKYQEKLKPSFKCNKNDFFTVSNSKGNKALTYPIGLLSADEARFAGAQHGTLNTDYYLYNEDQPWWLMDAAGSFYNEEEPDNSTTLVVSGSEGLFANDVRATLNVRPVINLKNNVVYKSGDGTHDNPYKFELK